MRKHVFALVVAFLTVASCGGDGGDVAETPAPTQPVETLATTTSTTTAALPQLEPMAATDLLAAEGAFNDLVGAALAADSQHDPAVSRPFLAEDIVVTDANASSPTVGVEDVLAMYANVWALVPNERYDMVESYTGLADGVALLHQHGLFGYTAENPLIEYRIFGLRDGQVAYWTAFYDPLTRPVFVADPAVDEAADSLRTGYIAAWAGRDPAAVGALFAADAVYDDPLAGGTLVGPDAIESFAESFFAAYPDVEFALESPIASRDVLVVRTGAVVTVSMAGSGDSDCPVKMLFILEGSDLGIVSARVYYEAGPLAACGFTA